MTTRALLAATLLLTFGCARRVPVSYEEPPPIFIEPNAPLFVKADTQDRGAGNNVLQVMGSIGQGLMLNKWAAVPVVEREFADAMRRSGFTVAAGPQGAVLLLNVEPLNWSGETTEDAKKNRVLVAGVLTVEAVFVDPTAAPGAPVVLSRRFTGRGSISRGEQSAMEDAARSCAEQLVRELSPKHVALRMPLDDSDPAAEPGVQAAGNARFEEALQLFTEASAKAPQSAPLLYNRGVLLMWKGQLDEADAIFSQAVKLRPDSGDYAQAKTFSERAIRARAGWGGRTPPPPVR